MKKVRKSTLLTIVILIIIFIVAKYYQFYIADDDNLLITNKIMNCLIHGTYYGEKSFDFCLIFYRPLYYLFEFNNIATWNVLFAVLYNFILLLFLFEDSKYDFSEKLFIFSSIFILDFTVFNLNKDLIQFTIFLIIYSIVFKKSISNFKKIFAIFIIIIVESIFFRSYYIITAGMFLIIYFVINILILDNKTKKKNIILSLILIFFIFFLIVYIMKYVNYEFYFDLINRRKRLIGNSANTIITNVIFGTSYFTFIINYFINLIRIIFPIELVLNIKYIPFVIYQIFLSFNIIKGLKRINKKNLIFISLILAYVLTLICSESDFGTLIRHQTLMFLFYLKLILENKKMRFGLYEKI